MIPTRWCLLGAVGVVVTLVAFQPVALTAQPQSSSSPAQQEQPAGRVSVSRWFEFKNGILVRVTGEIGRESVVRGGQAPYRCVYLYSVVSARNFTLTIATAAGDLPSSSQDELDLSASNVDIGLAKEGAARLLGLDESHPYTKELVGSYVVTVSPAQGKTWGEVRSEEDLIVSATLDA